MSPSRPESGCCPPKPTIESRPLVSARQTSQLRDLFKVFASDTRLRLLHALVRAGEMRVTDLARAVDMKPQAVSNQLQRLADRGIVRARRDGNSVFYRIVDPCVPALLDQGLCLLEDAAARVGRSTEKSGPRDPDRSGRRHAASARG